MIPDEIVERVREAADIVQIIGEHVVLKRVGTDLRGPCPFHQGTHRNFSVSPSRNMYHCFVCGEGGDVFSFLRKRLGVSWPEAVRMVAGRCGIDVPETSAQREGPDPREPIWELNGTAAEYFSRMLWDDPVGAEARAYLQSRKIDRAVADKFALGFSPREIGLLRNHLTALGFDEKRLLEAGLMVKREEASVPRPRFVDRLVFPIFDVSSHCVGFGGRLLRDGEPKYLNSSDSPVFSKGRLLYGLNWARNNIRRENRAILVEGYFDVVRLVEAGVENVVAPLGTALTDEQVSLLGRYTRNVVLLYDNDSAGLKATFRAGDALLSQGFAVQVASLPPGDDPDSFAARAGRSGIDTLVSETMDVFERKVRLLEQKGWLKDISGKRRAIDKLVLTIRATADPVTRDLYISRAAEAVGVPRDTVLNEVAAGSGRGSQRGARVSAPKDSATAPVSATEEAPEGRRAVAPPAARRRAIRGEAHERAILAALIQAPSRLDWISERIGRGDFWVPEHRVIFDALMDAVDEVSALDIERVLPPEAVPYFQAAIEYGESLVDMPRTVDDSLKGLESRSSEKRRREIDRQMPLASTKEEGDELLREKDRLARPGGGTWAAVRAKQ